MTDFSIFWNIHPESVFFSRLLLDLKKLIKFITLTPLADVVFFEKFCKTSDIDLNTISSGCLRKSSFNIIVLFSGR